MIFLTIRLSWSHLGLRVVHEPLNTSNSGRSRTGRPGKTYHKSLSLVRLRRGLSVPSRTRSPSAPSVVGTPESDRRPVEWDSEKREKESLLRVPLPEPPSRDGLGDPETLDCKGTVRLAERALE